MRKYKNTRRYHFNDELIDMLQQLERFRVVEARFVRAAIEEKLKRDYPAIKPKKERVKYPF